MSDDQLKAEIIRKQEKLTAAYNLVDWHQGELDALLDEQLRRRCERETRRVS